jgi:hypothetical protein
MAISTILSTASAKDVAFRSHVDLDNILRQVMVDFEEFEDGNPITGFDGRNFLFRGYEDDEPELESEVWSTWDLKISRIVAEHMTSGRLILKFNIEGGDQEYHILTPGKAVKADLVALLDNI